MIKSQNARQRYESYLVEKRRLEEEEKKKLRKRFQQKENEKTKRNEIQKIERHNDVLKAGLEVTDTEAGTEQSIIEENDAFLS